MTNKQDKKFVKNLKLAMLESGLNQTALAKKLGLAPNSVNQWLTGKSNPKLSTLKEVAKATNKPLNYFFAEGGDNIFADRASNVNKGGDIEKDFKLLKAEMEIVKKEIENINLKIELLKKKK